MARDTANYLALLVLLFTVGCGDTAPTADSSATVPLGSDESLDYASPSIAPVQPSDPSAAGSNVNDEPFAVIHERTIPGLKRRLDIRLSRKVSEKELAAIAVKLRNADPNSYDRTFIGYYLPDMQVNEGYWATTNFDPNLEIRILGLTLEQEYFLKQKPDAAGRELIGTWIDQDPFNECRITIFRDGDGLFMEEVYKDGSVGIYDIVESPSQLGRRFERQPDRGTGDYVQINSAGDLESRDQEGLIATAKKLD